MKFTILEQAWLEELGLDLAAMAPGDLKAWKVRAKASASRVRDHFSDLIRDGELKEITAAYKLHRQTVEKPMSWNLFQIREQEKLIRRFAREQIERAGRGETVE